MSLRNKVEADSLEMLLDTMCNTFGGIILIALLIALISRQSRVDELENRQVTKSEEAVQRQIEEADRSAAQLRQQLAEAEARVQDPGQHALVQLLEQREGLRRASEALAEALRRSDPSQTLGSAATEAQIAARVQAITSQYQKADRQLLEERNLSSALMRKIEDLRKETRQESNRLAQVLQGQVQRLRMPREHETEKTFIYIILQHGKMYPLLTFQGGEPRQNALSLKWTQQGANLKRIETLRERGWHPDRDLPAIAQFFRDIPQDLYLVFEVYEDSFPAFNALKKIAAAQRLECTWEPRPNEYTLTIGGSVRPPPPQ